MSGSGNGVVRGSSGNVSERASASDKRPSINKRPSIFDVAQLAGVSHQTVSRVINHAPHVSEATRRKVQQAIEMLGYRPSNSARTLASSRSHTVAVVAGGLNRPGDASVIAAIDALAMNNGLFVTIAMMRDALCTQREFENRCFALEEQNVDAYIVIAPTDAMFSAACKMRLSKPRVLVTATHGGLSMAQAGRTMRSEERRHTAIVGVDQWGAVRDVAVLLNRLGHRSAWYFAGPLQWRDAVTRLAAWRKVSASVPIDSTVVQCDSWDSSEAYFRMNHELDASGSSGAARPTVVVTANDAQAVGVARALHEHGLRIPQDVSVVGFDDMLAMNDMLPPLTTVRPDFEQLGSAAMREALRLLGDGGETAFSAYAHGAGLVPANVVQRRSLGTAARA